VPGEHLEGVRVRPEWCRDLLGIDPAEHEDALDEVPAPLVRRLGRLADRLVRTRSPDGAVARLAYALGALAEAREPSSGARLAHRALEAVRARPQEPIDAGERARALGVSERHLRRVVREAAGTGLRAFHRVRRLQHAVSLADAAGMVRWSRLAVAAGYYDQAHLIHEVRACTGTTPAALHRERKTQRLVEGS
jgi:AraC-like DNA-binding protein